MFVIHSGEAEWPAKIETEENSVAAMLTQHCTAAGLIHKQPKKSKHATSNSSDTQPTAAAASATAAAATVPAESSTAGSTSSATTATLDDKKSKKPQYKPLLLTACTEPSTSGAGTVDIMLYPDAVIYTVQSTSAALQYLVQTVLLTAAVPADDVQQLESDLAVRPVTWRNLVLVCTHGSRDKRCGKAGPQAIAEMEAVKLSNGLTDSDVAIRGTSHIGGHKLAGVCIECTLHMCVHYCKQFQEQHRHSTLAFVALATSLHRVAVRKAQQLRLTQQRDLVPLLTSHVLHAVATVTHSCVQHGTRLKPNFRGNMHPDVQPVKLAYSTD
eukprot:14111-Heterococcus_DN1.PRE.7